MSIRRTKNESIENLKRVVDNEEKIPTTTAVDPVTADAYIQSEKAGEHVEEVKDELEKKAEAVITEAPNTGKEIKNDFTAKLVLDESISDFTLTEEEVPAAKDGRAHKFYDEDDEDDYLDYDMFDFIYGLVTDCWPKPINPLGGRLRKFMYIGSDKYMENPDRAENSDGHSQVASTGDTIEVYANETKDFDDIKKICDMYKFKYDGPTAKRSKNSHWNFSFNIHVPCEHSGYPMMVEDYFEDLGMKLEDVMPADFCKQYRKRQAKIDVEVEKRLAEREVEKLVNKAIMNAARNGDDPLDKHLKQLYADLDAAGLKYSKQKIKKTFYDAFADDEEDVEEGLISNTIANVGQTVGGIVTSIL